MGPIEADLGDISIARWRPMRDCGVGVRSWGSRVRWSPRNTTGPQNTDAEPPPALRSRANRRRSAARRAAARDTPKDSPRPGLLPPAFLPGFIQELAQVEEDPR